MNNNEIYPEIDFEEIEAFLQGELSEERDREVAEAIDNSPRLQEYIESSLDIDDIVLFDEMSHMKLISQTDIPKTNNTFVVSSSGNDSKWGNYLSQKHDFKKDTATWDDEKYRQAADKGRSKHIQLKSKKLVKKDDGKGHSFWGEIIIGIIILVIITLIRTCK